MKHAHTICIAGATDLSHLGLNTIDEARAFGGALAASGLVIHTATAPGFSFWVAKGARDKGAQVVGFSPAANKAEHTGLYRLPTDQFSSIVYTGFGYPGRNLMMMRSSDALIVGPGYIETFHEFLSALDENKIVGVWEGPWEIDDAIHDLIGKKGKSLNVVFEKDPVKLIKRIQTILDSGKMKA
jgi:predicted Rossmann-fold nucleotide-binding protein